MRLPARRLVAAAVSWGGAGRLHAITEHVSLVLLFAPGAFLGDRAPNVARRARNDSRFGGIAVTVIRHRAPLLGLPPRLFDVRLVHGPTTATG